MFKVVIGRTATMHGVSVGKEMGINTWAAFAGSDDAAVVDGDFAMIENELQPVLRAMRKEGINIVAIHQHMSHEQPRYPVLALLGQGQSGGPGQVAQAGSRRSGGGQIMSASSSGGDAMLKGVPS